MENEYKNHILPFRETAFFGFMFKVFVSERTFFDL